MSILSVVNRNFHLFSIGNNQFALVIDGFVDCLVYAGSRVSIAAV